MPWPFTQRAGTENAARSAQPPTQRRRAGSEHSSGGDATARRTAPDPALADAFDVLKRSTPSGDRVAVEDLGDLLFLVLRTTYTPERLASMVRVLNPVHEVDFLDTEQCARETRAASTRAFARETTLLRGAGTLSAKSGPSPAPATSPAPKSCGRREAGASSKRRSAAPATRWPSRRASRASSGSPALALCIYNVPLPLRSLRLSYAPVTSASSLSLRLLQ